MWYIKKEKKKKKINAKNIYNDGKKKKTKKFNAKNLYNDGKKKKTLS